MRSLMSLLASAVAFLLTMGGPPKSIDDVIEKEMPASGVPGLAYAVVAGGHVTSIGALGVVTAGSDTAVTPDTPFLTGSVSKSFTALAIMQLVEAGAVDIDTGVGRYLDGFSARPAGAITLRQLLSHTSGYSTLQGNTSFPDGTGRTDELARRVDRLAAVTPAGAPGVTWEYSNANYEILGRVIEVVGGEDFQSYVAEHILEPVGMTHSFVADGQVHGSMATGHRPWFGTKQPLAENRMPRGTAPQGGIVASAGDLALYLAMMMNGRDDVLSAAGKSQMMRPASAAAPFYGLGWFVDAGAGTVWHSGSSPGYESLATMVPAAHTGVVVLVNAGNGMGFGETERLRDGITAAALGLDRSGEDSRLPQQVLFVALVLLPIAYLLCMIWAWRHRAELRLKSGAAGRFSLWFPLLTTLAAAWVILDLVPTLIGSPLLTISVFQPDLGVVLIAAAVTGVLWAVFRLGVAVTGRARPGDAPSAGRRGTHHSERADRIVR